MDVIEKIIDTAIDSGKGNNELFLKALDEAQIFRGKENVLEHTIGKINTLLQKETTRDRGFNLILQLLPQCGPEVLDERGLSWLLTAVKTCGSQQATAPAFKVIGALIRNSTNSPDFVKTITHTIMQKVFEACRQNDTDKSAALDCMIDCMLTFPGPCGPSKSVVEETAVQFVSSNDAALVSRAGNCMLLLQAIKTGGEQGQMHRKYYVEYQLQLIDLIHKQYDQLFTQITESFEEDRQEPELTLKLPEILDKPLERISKIIQVIKNLLQFLNISLLAPFPVAKIIQVQQILYVIKRGLYVDPKLISKTITGDNLMIGFLLSEVHIEAFATLNSLMDICKGNMRIFCSEILDLYHTTLKWSCSGESMGCKKPYTTVRGAAYHSATQWITLLGRSSLIEDIAETVVLAVINDSTPYKTEVKLQVQMDGGRNLSKRAKKKMMKTANEATHLAQSHSNQKGGKSNLSDEGNVDLCTAALTCCTALLESVGCLLKPTQMRTLQQHLVQQCLSLEMHSQTKEQLFFASVSRKALYRALFALTTNPHHLAPPPTQYVLSILTTATQTDIDPCIRDLCVSQIFALGRSIRPQRQSLYFEASIDELDDAIKSLRKDTLEFDVDVELKNGHVEEALPEPQNNNEIVDVDAVDEDVQIIEEEPRQEFEEIIERLKPVEVEPEEIPEEPMEMEELEGPTPELLKKPEVNDKIELKTTTVTKTIKKSDYNNMEEEEIDKQVEVLFKDFVPE